MNCSGAAKTAKSVATIYERMKVKDPKEEEETLGERRVYKGSMKSQFDQHIAWLESKNAGNH